MAKKVSSIKDQLNMLNISLAFHANYLDDGDKKCNLEV
jgi:hypothetical protein